MSVIPGIETQILEYFFQADATVARISDTGGDSWVSLCSASPGESGTSANELTSPRQEIDQWTAPFVSGGVLQCISAEEITFTTGDSGVATHFLLSPVSTTTHLFLDTLATSVTFGTSDVVRIRSGKMVITCSGLFSADGGFGQSAPGYALFQNLLRAGSVADKSSGYFGLSSTAPAPDGTNVTEPTVGAYARTSSITFSSTLFSGASTSGSSPTTLTNTSAVVWPTATASWGTMTHWVCYSASTGGYLLYYGTLDNPAEVTNGLQPRFAVGDLVFSCD